MKHETIDFRESPTVHQQPELLTPEIPETSEILENTQQPEDSRSAAADPASSATQPQPEQGDETEVEVNEPSQDECVCAVEALLFASGEPLSALKISQVAEIPRDKVQEALEVLRQSCNETSGRGLELKEVAGKWQLRTKSSERERVRRLKAAKPRRLSSAALETLAIVAYRQPIVKSDIEKIRGVDTSPTLKTLSERGLVKIAGYQNTVGQPALYGTTEEFLRVFGLSKLPDLPNLREVVEYVEEPGGHELNEEGAMAGVGTAPQSAQQQQVAAN